jgi:hypothetical protein
LKGGGAGIFTGLSGGGPDDQVDHHSHVELRDFDFDERRWGRGRGGGFAVARGEGEKQNWGCELAEQVGLRCEECGR